LNQYFDVKTRNYAYHNWLNKTSCLVIDEAHLIGQKGRGDAIEASLMRFTEKNKNARLILLSATMENEVVVAKWIKKLK
jgi:helicase